MAFTFVLGKELFPACSLNACFLARLEGHQKGEILPLPQSLTAFQLGEEAGFQTDSYRVAMLARTP